MKFDWVIWKSGNLTPDAWVLDTISFRKFQSENFQNFKNKRIYAEGAFLRPPLCKNLFSITVKMCPKLKQHVTVNSELALS